MQPQPPEHSLPEDSGFDPRFEGEDLELCRELLPRAREVVEDPVVRAAVAELVSELADSPHVRGIARERVVAYVDGVAVMKAMSSLANRESVPQLLRSPYPFGRAGLDNPDNVYRTARLDGSLGYVLEGERNSSYDLYLQLMDGQPGEGDSLHETLGLLSGDDLDLDPAGCFRVTLDARDAAQVGGPHLMLPPGPSMLILRDTLNDWSDEVPAALRLRQLSGPARELPSEDLAQEVAARTRDAVVFWDRYTARLFGLPAQTVLDPAPSVGGLPGQVSAYGRFDLAPGEALELTVEHCGAPYLGLQLGDALFVSTDYWDHASSLNLTQAHVDAGRVRYVIAAEDPGVANWIDTAGDLRGLIFLRWQGLAPDVVPGPVGVRVVAVQDVAATSGLPLVDSVQRRAAATARRADFDRRGVSPT